MHARCALEQHDLVVVGQESEREVRRAGALLQMADVDESRVAHERHRARAHIVLDGNAGVDDGERGRVYACAIVAAVGLQNLDVDVYLRLGKLLG